MPVLGNRRRRERRAQKDVEVSRVDPYAGHSAILCPKGANTSGTNPSRNASQRLVKGQQGMSMSYAKSNICIFPTSYSFQKTP